ncbi:pca operon transcription factor PcaQ [Polaromonas sp. SM01]|uniref:pca operon transcription factor PcaQ n=1 Tax=Polaromonas sp. SM01 TaxID=3085630 RepID=UPI002981305F|nr:pca operon transcription factor PcaQ [Polaromonas sp. SM01]MDW5442442.1 pca operon transcription factor PcaQ [Polaromonas sp. SM01]
MIDGHIKFRHLQCFLAVAQHGSLQKAAGALSITQPAVSKTLKELESLLAVRLFERGRRGAVLTREGEAFTRHAGASVSALREAVASVAQVSSEAGAVVTIGVLPTVAPSLMPEVLLLMDSQQAKEPAWPRSKLRIHTASNPQLLNQLRQRELDMVIGRFAEPSHMLGLSFEHLYAEPLVLAVRPGHPLLAPAAAGQDPLLQLARFTVILPMQGTAIRHSADTFLLQRGLGRLAHTLETLSVSLARHYAAASDAVCLFPRGALAAELASGALVRLPVNTAGTEERVGLTLRADMAATPAQQQLINTIRLVAHTYRLRP